VGRRTLLLIASILVAALGTTLVWLYVQGADTRAQADTALVPVLFVTKEAPAGTPITGLATQTEQVPATVAQGAVTSPQQVSGQQLKTNVVPGTMLTPTMFSAKPQTEVDKGKAYVAITITDPHRVPALLKQGDRVAVYALSGKGGTGSGTELINPDIQVQTIGNVTQTGPNGTVVPVSIVGFYVDPDQIKDFIGIEATGGEPVLALLGEGATGR
jgi:pilus assembly protein CpaB